MTATEPANLAPEPDAQGQAALLLTESLIHTLVDKGLLTIADAVALVQSAAEVKVEVADEAGESKGRMRESLAFLSKMAGSFGADAASRARLTAKVVKIGE
ncbi:MAG: hypothetical protein H7124_11285 [Phycisphaerales bacterium]|nr:hypothetical protein [Hyphomonadaceae bacterium]